MGWKVFLDLKTHETQSTTIQVIDWVGKSRIDLMTVVYTPETRINIKHKRYAKELAVKTLTTSSMIEEKSFKNRVSKVHAANFDGIVCPAIAAL